MFETAWYPAWVIDPCKNMAAHVPTSQWFSRMSWNSRWSSAFSPSLSSTAACNWGCCCKNATSAVAAISPLAPPSNFEFMNSVMSSMRRLRKFHEDCLLDSATDPGTALILPRLLCQAFIEDSWSCSLLAWASAAATDLAASDLTASICRRSARLASFTCCSVCTWDAATLDCNSEIVFLAFACRVAVLVVETLSTCCLSWSISACSLRRCLRALAAAFFLLIFSSSWADCSFAICDAIVDAASSFFLSRTAWDPYSWLRCAHPAWHLRAAKRHPCVLRHGNLGQWGRVFIGMDGITRHAVQVFQMLTHANLQLAASWRRFRTGSVRLWR